MCVQFLVEQWLCLMQFVNGMLNCDACSKEANALSLSESWESLSLSLSFGRMKARYVRKRESFPRCFVSTGHIPYIQCPSSTHKK